MKSENGSLNSQERQAMLNAHVQRLHDTVAGRILNEDRTSALPLESIVGIPGLAADAQHGLVVEETYPLQRTARHWSDILSAASGNVFVWDRPLADSALRTGFDPTMYETYRDILPPRASCLSQANHNEQRLAADESLWRADLVAYRDGILPTGEFYRSVGHWNPPDEWEVFQVCRGEAAILAAYRQPDGEWSLHVTICGVGEGCIIKPGGWHLTYALANNPIILNIYSCTALDTSQQTVAPLSKYATRSHNGPEFSLVQHEALPRGIWRVNNAQIDIPLQRAENGAFFDFLMASSYKWLGTWFAQSHQPELDTGIEQLTGTSHARSI